MRVAVIGLGGVGSATARFLAQAGHRVVGFEQYALDHDRGSSYGGSRIIRRVYPDALYARLMDTAYPLWEALEQESGEALLLRCGGFFFAPKGDATLAATEAALTSVGVPFQHWSAQEAARRLPQFRLRPEECGLFEPQSGLLRASRCVLANTRLARHHGAELREGAQVETLEPSPESVRLRVGSAWETFDRVVVNAGPWTEGLLRDYVQLPLTVTRQQYAHFSLLEDDGAFDPERFPVWIDFAEEFYGFPRHDNIPGVKVALHHPGPPHDPDSPDREPWETDNRVLREYMERRLPAASGPVTYSKVCLYTMTPDTDFIIDRLPEEPRVVYVGGLSGHGFKFTVLLGQIAATLAQDGEPPHDVSRFALSRFGSATTAPSPR